LNKFFKSLIVLAVLAFTIGGAQAYELKKSELEKIIVNEILTQSWAQLRKFSPNEIDVKIINLQIEDVTKTSQKPTVKVASNFDRFMQYDIKRVTIQDGTSSRSIPVNVKVAVYKDVLVAKELIPQFQLVTQGNTYIKRLDVANNIENTMSAFPGVLVASRNISKDAPVLNLYTKQKPEIVRNSDVKVLFTQGDELSIELDATALKEGRIGDIITVKNTKYNKVYTATVIGENKVEVKL